MPPVRRDTLRTYRWQLDRFHRDCRSWDPVAVHAFFARLQERGLRASAQTPGILDAVDLLPMDRGDGDSRPCRFNPASITGGDEGYNVKMLRGGRFAIWTAVGGEIQKMSLSPLLAAVVAGDKYVNVHNPAAGEELLTTAEVGTIQTLMARGNTVTAQGTGGTAIYAAGTGKFVYGKP